MALSTRWLFVVGSLLTLLLELSRPAACHGQDWIDGRRADTFIYRANYRLDNPEPFFGQLGQLKADLIATLGVQPSEELVELYLFRDRASYRQYMDDRYPGVPSRRALFVKHHGPGMIYAYQSGEFEVDLRHETTHALLHASLCNVPLWLDEGLAEYFEMPAAERPSGHSHLSQLQQDLGVGLLPRLRSLETKREVAEMGRAEYRASWAWVHFLLHGPAIANKELMDYLTDLRTEPVPTLLSARLERRLPEVEQRFAEHFRQWKP